MRNNQTSDVLSQALAEPSRRALLENLRLGQRTVSQLVEATGLKQPNVSNHLAKMRTQGIVRAERVGRQVYYALSTPFAESLLRMLESVHREENEFEEQEPSVTTMLAEWRGSYFRAIIEGDEDKTIGIVNNLLAHRLSMELIYTGVFQWSINLIGEMFERGETDEAHEHMASAITERMMARVALFYTPVVRTMYRAVLGCVPGNWHSMGLRMLGDGLRNIGWETVFLGANVPTSSFLAMTEAMWPDLVVISCAMEEQLPDAEDLMKRLDLLRHSQVEKRTEFKLVAGGHYFQAHPGSLRDLPVDFTASDLRQFIVEIQQRFPAARVSQPK